MSRALATLCLRKFSSSRRFKPQICIIGAGPAGFYAAQQLVKKLDPVKVDIYERLPVPFGLVRFGVAPDHPEVKNVINTFTKTAEHSNIDFIGNVALGRNITLQELQEAYHVVLMTYGADNNRKLNIPGETLQNVIPAKDFVGWYNGVPWNKNLKLDLSKEEVAIFGQGNVAIDIARILLSPIDSLRKTDITEHSLEALSKSQVQRVNLIGRRGPLQAAFTIKELREMLKLPQVQTNWLGKDFEQIIPLLSSLQRPKKRLMELMVKSLEEPQVFDEKNKVFNPIFLRSPLQFKGNLQIDKVLLQVNELKDNVALATQKQEELSCNLAITSIGYKSLQADQKIPFNHEKGVVINENSRVSRGLYVSGWLGTGPTGVILTTMNSAFITADQILQDIQKENLINSSKPGFELIKQSLDKQNLQVVLWKDWLKIDEQEKLLGEKLGKPREKILDVKAMLKLAE